MRRKLRMAEISEILYQWNKGRKLRAIARSLGISRTTVRDAIRKAEAIGLTQQSSTEEINRVADELLRSRYQSIENPTEQKLNPVHESIQEWLDEPWMTVTQINRLLAERSIAVSETSLRRYLKKYFATTPVSTMHLTTEPGKEAQVDFGYVGKLYDTKTKKDRKAYVFVMSMSHSRHRYVEFVFKQDSKTWLQCHINAFNYFGGVPRAILLDNLKAGVLSANVYDPILNKAYTELSRHYDFIIDPCKARTPEHKGKVERSIRIIKEQLIAGRQYHDIHEANAKAKEWCQHDIGQRVCRSTGQKPMEAFETEKSSLLPLPKEIFDIPTWQQAIIHRDNHLVYGGNFYSAPYQHIGSEVLVRAGLKTVQIYKDHKLIKTHILVSGKGNWQTDDNDYPKRIRIYLEQDRSNCLERAKEIGDSAYCVIKEILSKESKQRLRKACATLRLADSFTPQRLENACLRAFSYNNTEYCSIKKILEKGLDEQEVVISIPDYGVALASTNAYLRPASEFIPAAGVAQ